MVKRDFYHIMGVFLAQLLILSVPMNAQQKQSLAHFSTKKTAPTTLRIVPEGAFFANHLHLTQIQTLQQKGITVEMKGVHSSTSSRLRSHYPSIYTEDFASSEGFGRMTIIDHNGDDNTWVYDLQNKRLIYPYNLSAADDWAVTPAVPLTGGRLYYVGCSAHAGSVYDSERMEAKWGKAATVEALTNELLPEMDVYSPEPISYEREIKITETGDYFFGIHAISDANKYQLHLRKIYVLQGPLLTSPDKVDDLKITPDATGFPKAKVSFRAPSQNIDGSPVTTLSRIDIIRAGQVIKSFANPQAGAVLEYEDVEAQNGVNIYTVIAYAGEEIGRKTQAAARVGVDLPQPPEKFKAFDNGTQVRFTWDPVSNVGETGGYVNPAAVTYYLHAINQEGEVGDRIATINETSYLLDNDPNEGEQDIMTWYLSAGNAAGVSDFSSTSLLVGAPYAVPFQESFTGAKIGSVVWINKNEKQSFVLVNDHFADKDGGSVAFRADKDTEWSAINFGKVGLQGVNNPYIVFHHKCTEQRDVRMEVIAKTPDGQEHILETIDYSTDNLKSWKMKKVSLQSLKNERYVTLRFKAYGRANVMISLDAISIVDMPSHDLELGVATPQKAIKGEPFPVEAFVKNVGEHPVSSYTLTLFVNGKEKARKSVETPFTAFGETQTVAFENVRVESVAGVTAQVKVVVTTPNDPNAENNMQERVLPLIESSLPRANALEAQVQGVKVALKWQAPASVSMVVEEGFENYNPWTTTFGGWSTVNGNEAALAGALFKRRTYPLQGTAFAFCIMNPNSIFAECTQVFPDMAPRTGDQYAMSIYESVDGKDVDNDDWLIFPLLSGERQTVRFWALNQKSGNDNFPETFDLLVSKGEKELSAFEKLGEAHTVSSGAWEEVRVELPEGVRYLALHRTTNKNNAYMLGIDDVTFKASAGKVIGYNVYRNGQLITTLEGADITSLETDRVENEDTYAVTVLFDGGKESAPIEVKLPTSIEEILKEQANADVYTVDGRLIRRNARDLKGLPEGIYIINNQKYLLH